jgi:GAF domain
MSESLSCHYHIRWSRCVPLDFEPFASPQEADSCAGLIALPGESYSVEKFDRDCIRCKLPSEDSLRQVLAITIRKAGAESGGLWVLNKDTGTLRIVAQRGFSPRLLEFLSVVHEDFAACGATLKRGERVLVDDVTTDPVYKGNVHVLEIMRRERVRSIQSLPLFASSGHLAGVIAVHYRACGMASIAAYQLESRHVRDVADHFERFVRRQNLA